MSAIQGLLKYFEVNGRAVGTLIIIVRHIVGVRYSGVSVKWGFTVLHNIDWTSMQQT